MLCPFSYFSKTLIPDLTIHSHEELCIVASARHKVMNLLHCLYGVHVGDALAEYPHTVDSCFIKQQVITTSAGSNEVDGWEDTLVGKRTVELQLGVASALEFLEDYFVHLTASVSKGCGDNSERTTILNVTGCTKEALWLLQSIGIYTTSENLA